MKQDQNPTRTNICDQKEPSCPKCKSYGRHLKKHFADTTTLRSKPTLSTASSECADTGANLAGSEMVEKEDAIEEEAKEVVIFDEADFKGLSR